MILKTIYVIKDYLGSIRYVGLTQDFSARQRQHLTRMSTSNLPLYCWMRKNQFDFQTLQTFQISTQKDLEKAEIYWIKYFRDAGCDLLNCTDGGGLYNPTEEVRKKISDAKKELYRDPRKNPMFGKPNPRRKLLSRHTRKMQALSSS